METAKTVWGIDIGQWALKAVELRGTGEGVDLEGFEVIEHAGSPPAPGPDRGRLLRETLHRFLDRVSLEGTHVVVSVPGRCGCTHFVHLLPVDSGSVPKLVRYEAAQQVPFPLEESIWRWQTFRDPDRPEVADVDVGIFALRRSDVGEMLLLFAEANVNVDTMQMVPLALHNVMTFDGQLAEDGATMLVDVGAAETNVVVADGRRIYTRAIELGGERLTEAIAPVAGELAEAVRRAADAYTSEHPEAAFRRVLATGGAVRLPALRASLEQALGMPVGRIEGFRRLAGSARAREPAFAENVPALAAAYGLALQGLGVTAIHANFLPSGIAHKWGWQRGKPPGALRRFLRGMLGRRGDGQ